MRRPAKATRGKRWTNALLLRGLLLAALWILLVADDPDKGPLFGTAAVVIALAASLILSPPANVGLGRPVDVSRYLALFIWHSLIAGADIARRALHPRLPIDPGWRHYTVHLPPGPARAVLLGTITLLPGTLSAEMEGGELWVHVLDVSLPVDDEFAAWERRVARLFRVELVDPEEEP